MIGTISPAEEAQLMQTIEMFEVITQSQSADYQSLEILKEAYLKLNRQKDVINTSKRIAQAYMQLGQFSSAILEYETILQRYPDDPDVLAAIAEIESKANSLTASSTPSDTDTVVRTGSTTQTKKSESKKRLTHADIDDGKVAMQKLFVEGKHISPAQFTMCWPEPPLNEAPGRAIEPFIFSLAEKSMLPLERSLKIMAEKSRLGFLPLERYDIDVETARTFPREICQRWCILPFDKLSKSVMVATANPFNKYAAEELQATTQNRLIWYLAPPPDLLKGLRKIFR
jgi:tetratricopeptide (TPR) repeat protein